MRDATTMGDSFVKRAGEESVNARVCAVTIEEEEVETVREGRAAIEVAMRIGPTMVRESDAFSIVVRCETR